MSEKNLLQLTPWVLARDVEAMVRFFAEVLGFHAWVSGRDYAYLDRDDVAVRIGKLSDEGDERVEVGARAWLFYIDVRDVDAMVEEVRPRLLAAGMAAGQGPKDQSWGKREFWVPVPEGGFIILGQEIVAPPEIGPTIEA